MYQWETTAKHNGSKVTLSLLKYLKQNQCWESKSHNQINNPNNHLLKSINNICRYPWNVYTQSCNSLKMSLLYSFLLYKNYWNIKKIGTGSGTTERTNMLRLRVKCTYFWINDSPNFLFAWTHKPEAGFYLPSNNQ